MLTLQFVPYGEVEKLNSEQRIDKLMKIVKEEKIVLMQGRLKPEEEILLIKATMEGIAEGFKGVETCTIYPEEKDLQFFNKVKKEMVKFLVGHRDGITIIGPASIVKEIRRDPNKIQLLTVSSAVGGIKSSSRRRNSRKRVRRKTATRKRTRRKVTKRRRRR